MPRNQMQTWKTYPPALIALACSLVFCCPLASLLGVVVGWFALRVIDSSGGVYGGRRIAIWAIILGVCMLPFQMILIQKYQAMSTDLIRSDVMHAVEVVFDVEADDRKEALESVFLRHKGSYPTPEEADAFVESVTSDLGAFVSVSIAQLSVSSDLPRPVHEIALVFEFENDSATGGAVCELHAALGAMLEIRLDLLEVTLPGGQLVQLPVSDVTPAGESGDDLEEGAPQDASTTRATDEVAP